MALLLNITTETDNKTEEKSAKLKSYQSRSGFEFEFKKNETVKATVIAKKKVDKSIKTVISDKKVVVEKPESKGLFKDILKDNEAPPEPTLFKHIWKNDSTTEKIDSNGSKNQNFDIPKALPTVDFPDAPKKKMKKKGKQIQTTDSDQHRPALLPVVDFVKEEQNMKKDIRPIKRKERPKFSKVSNPFPNDPSKNPIKKSDTSESMSKPQKQTSDSLKNNENDGNKSVFSSDSVETLKIHAFSIKNMKEVLNFNKLTHVQHKSIPAALEGKDLLIRSPTGSGKTLSYALPIVEKLHNIRPQLTRSEGIHALVIVPTRELAVQTYELFLKLVKPYQWIVPGYLSGGEKRKAEKSRLRNGITILISTPGRICDHLLHTESMKLDKIQFFVLDEADRLLELGYENDVKKVVDTITVQNKESRTIQKILLSATLTSNVKKLAGLTLDNPIYVDNDTVGTISDSMENIETDDNIAIPSGIIQKYFDVPPKLRFVILLSLIVEQMRSGAKKILIFFPTQHVVDFHYDIMVEFLTQSFHKTEKTAKSYLEDDDGLDMDEEGNAEDEDEENIWLPNVTLFKLFGSMTQIERVSVFREFKSVKEGILLCTDVAARGLDVPKLDLVIQYSSPQELNNYIHRIGRTARAGNSGNSILFITKNEEKFIDLLREKNVEISMDDYHKYLKSFQLPKTQMRFFEDKIVALQRKLEDLIANDQDLREKASKSFTSWICYYKTFSKELRNIFNLREIHMGHIANSFGLKDAPKAIVKQYSNASENRKEKNKNFDFEHRVHVPRGDQRFVQKLKRKYGDFSKTNFGKTSNVSEFDSGLPDLKKKKKKEV